MSLVIISFALYMIYTFIGATALTVTDRSGSLLRRFDSKLAGDQMLFWMAWPLVLARHHVHECRR